MLLFELGQLDLLELHYQCLEIFIEIRLELMYGMGGFIMELYCELVDFD